MGDPYAHNVEPTDAGARVTIRFREPDGLRDAVGELRSWADGVLRILRRTGEVVTIDERALVARKLIEPSPVRAISAPDLERVAARGWPAPDTAPLGEWLLRAADGFTWRGNSVLVVGDPDRPLDAAIDAAGAWYEQRGLPLRLSIPLPAGAALDAVLTERGWSTAYATQVMTGAASQALACGGEAGDDRVAISDVPGPDWLGIYRRQEHGGRLPPVAERLLTDADHVRFATVRVDGETVAVGRVVVEGEWAGLTAIEVLPEHRRAGLGLAVTLALVHAAVDAGARWLYLQVSEDNLPAIALYERLGFALHHCYHYRVPGEGP